MLYAILAYHVEEEVTSWTPEQDATVMRDLTKAHGRLNEQGRLGPAARLGARNSCWASTFSTAPTATPPYQPRATCARPIPLRCMRYGP
jgi:hypothetical protein